MFFFVFSFNKIHYNVKYHSPYIILWIPGKKAWDLVSCTCIFHYPFNFYINFFTLKDFYITVHLQHGSWKRKGSIFLLFKHSLGATLIYWFLKKPAMKARDPNRASGIKISHQRENSSRHMPGMVSPRRNLLIETASFLSTIKRQFLLWKRTSEILTLLLMKYSAQLEKSKKANIILNYLLRGKTL